MDDINSDLCCICQLWQNERLKKPRKKGLITLERDLNDINEFNSFPYGMSMSSDEFTDGSNITSNHVVVTVVALVLRGYTKIEKNVHRVLKNNSGQLGNFIFQVVVLGCVLSAREKIKTFCIK